MEWSLLRPTPHPRMNVVVGASVALETIAAMTPESSGSFEQFLGILTPDELAQLRRTSPCIPDRVFVLRGDVKHYQRPAEAWYFVVFDFGGEQAAQLIPFRRDSDEGGLPVLPSTCRADEVAALVGGAAAESWPSPPAPDPAPERGPRSFRRVLRASLDGSRAFFERLRSTA